MSLVVDASVAAKWFMTEVLYERARTLLIVYSGVIEAPDFLITEIANIAWKKHQKGEISQQQAMAIPNETSEYCAKLHSSLELIDRSIEIATTLGHPVYDCLYIACAERINGTVVTADNRLCKAVESTVYAPHVHHLNDYDILLESFPPPLPLRIAVGKVELLIRMAEAFEKMEGTLKNMFPPDEGESFSGNKDDIAQRMWTDSPSFHQFFDHLERLSQEERVDVCALLFLGENPNETRPWSELRKAAREALTGGGFEHLLLSGPREIAVPLRNGLKVLGEFRYPR